jgi:hypothetical protein
MVMLIILDGHAFWVASPPDLSADRRAGLYQTEVTGLVSAALLFIRLFAQLGSTLLVWRLIFILLGKSGLSFVEICRMVDLKIPILPRLESANQFQWSFLTIVVVLCLWPPSLSAPLANSSLGWIPSTQLASDTVQEYNVSTIKPDPSWFDLIYPAVLSSSIIQASIMASKEPSYAFISSGDSSLLRRYIYLPTKLVEGGIGNVTLPFFEIVGIEWLDNPDGQVLSGLNSSSMLETPIVPEAFPGVGTVMFFKTAEEKWKLDMIYAYKPDVFEGKKKIVIVTSHIDNATRLENGNYATKDTPCPSNTESFGKIPKVKQYPVPLWVGAEWRATDCYMLGEVTIKAGLCPDWPSNITTAGPQDGLHIASPLLSNEKDLSLTPDVAVMPTLDMMSDVANVIVSQHMTAQWQKEGNLDGYVTGMLTLAYHATWSTMPLHLDRHNETIAITPMDPVVRASVKRSRIYIWLAMNATLTIAAVLIGIAQCFSSTKVVRNTTLAALTLDVSEVTHETHNGFCNAVAMNKDDKSLGRMKWKEYNECKTTLLGAGNE